MTSANLLISGIENETNSNVSLPHSSLNSTTSEEASSKPTPEIKMGMASPSIQLQKDEGSIVLTNILNEAKAAILRFQKAISDENKDDDAL